MRGERPVYQKPTQGYKHYVSLQNCLKQDIPTVILHKWADQQRTSQWDWSVFLEAPLEEVMTSTLCITRLLIEQVHATALSLSPPSSREQNNIIGKHNS